MGINSPGRRRENPDRIPRLAEKFRVGRCMKNSLSPDQDKLHKNIIRDRYLSGFKQPGRFRAEWERVKQLFRGKGHE
ncbi:DUF2740 family protein [Cronobacter dublinensis]